MPSKYVVRQFHSEGYYHIYNRGVEKRVIFVDDQDRKIFLYYLFIYLAPIEKVLLKYPQLVNKIIAKSLAKDINLIAYCLMPNHFHLLLKQNSDQGVSKLLKQLTNAYTRYFNHKYNRVGPLLQGRFKAVEVENDDQLLHLTRYIHLNPVVANLTDSLDYPWSSYSDYIHTGQTFLHKNEILGHFKSVSDYQEFVHNQIEYARELSRIKHLTLED